MPLKVVIPTTPHTRIEHQHHSTKNIPFRISHLRDMFSTSSSGAPLVKKPPKSHPSKRRHLQQSAKNPQGSPGGPDCHNATRPGQSPHNKNEKNSRKKKSLGRRAVEELDSLAVQQSGNRTFDSKKEHIK